MPKRVGIVPAYCDHDEVRSGHCRRCGGAGHKRVQDRLGRVGPVGEVPHRHGPAGHGSEVLAVQVGERVAVVVGTGQDRVSETDEPERLLVGRRSR